MDAVGGGTSRGGLLPGSRATKDDGDQASACRDLAAGAAPRVAADTDGGSPIHVRCPFKGGRQRRQIDQLIVGQADHFSATILLATSNSDQKVL